mgnify:CR=1 FL=1
MTPALKFVAAVTVAASLAVACPASAQNDVSARKTVKAVKTDVAPVLDGELDDWAWMTAAIVDDLHVVSPDEGAKPTERSRFYVTYGDDALYVAAEFFDSEPDGIVANVLRQGDYSPGDDGVMLILDPFNQGRSGYAFYLMANAVRAQALYKNVTEENWNWDGIWHAATKRTAEGWNAEIEIPFKTLSFDPSNQTWGINFSRYIGRRTEEIGWVSHNRKQNPAAAGEIIGLRGLQQGLGIDVVPAVVVTEQKDFATGVSRLSTEPSLDVTWKPTPALTAALTLNTDFSGTSADQRQINLTRFDVFFPEKRKFFLQDMDIFEFGRIGTDGEGGGGGGETAFRESGRPFFSRRIGLSAGGETIDIEGGLKLTGRVGDVDYGVLGMRQAAFGGVDAQTLFVGRVSLNVLEESAIGVIGTYGDPLSNVDNSLVGVDFRYLNTRLRNGKTLEGAAWYQQSDTPGLDGDDAAFGFSLKAPNSAGWNGELGFREVQRNFNPALGFVNQADVQSIYGTVAHTWRRDWRHVRSVTSGVSGRRVQTIGGELDNEELRFNVVDIVNHTGDSLSATYMTFGEQLAQPFEISEGVFIPAGRYDWNRYCVRVGTGEHRAVSVFGWACDGDFYDGTRRSTGPRVTWRPNKHLALQASYQVNDIDLPYGSFVTRQATLQADLAFTSTWYWENLVQYDNVSDSLGINSIMRWVPLAGRELVLVVNREFTDPLEQRDFNSSFGETAMKFHYTFRF